MKEKKNDFWRLDLLEAKFTNVTPRFKFTKKLINAHNNSQLLKKLPNTRNEALQQILALKSDLFEKKYHGAHKRLSREVSRMFKQQRSKSDRNQQLETLFNDKDFVSKLVSAKLAKIISTAILTNKDLKMSPPPYIQSDVISIVTDKSNPCNPTAFFIKYCQSDKVINGYVSKLWNIKEMKTLCSEVDWSFRKIRGNLSKEEIAQRTKSAPTKGAATPKASSDSDSDDSDDGYEDSGDEGAEFDQMVAGSEDEEDEDIGDDISEASEDEHSLKLSKDSNKKNSGSTSFSKETISNLPELATGYFSGGSDDEEDVDNDKVVKEATTARKNRRGQRARQKIWEQKYGSKANHVQQENKRIASERERKQQEFEERQRKRDLKAKALDSQDGTKHNPTNPNKLHPSWEARKLAEQKQKDIKFSGKKITFD